MSCTPLQPQVRATRSRTCFRSYGPAAHRSWVTTRGRAGRMQQKGLMKSRSGLASRFSAWVLAACAVACFDEPDPRGPDLDGGVSLGSLDAGQRRYVQLSDGALSLVYEPVTALDILFVVDNSASMASQQEKLARELTRMVHVLTSGDRYAEREDQVPSGLSDKARRFTPVSSLHIGVVSTNMGGMDTAPWGRQTAADSCVGLGDDAKLQHSTENAVRGVVARRQEFDGYLEGETVIAPSPECVLPDQPAYQSYLTSGDPSEVGLAFRCVARLGVRGCPFEQQLEAMWKALAPSTAPKGAPTDLFTFRDRSTGQGDRANEGFLRENAVLAVVHLTDEEDCSITDAGKVLFSLRTEATSKYGPLDLRCALHAEDKTLVYDTERYVSGLHSLKPGHPERIVFAAVVGVPAGPIAAGASYDDLLALPEMQLREQPLEPGILATSCMLMTDGRNNDAYPGRRFLQLAKSLGAHSVVESICAETYGPVIDQVINKIAPHLDRT
jgi:hypothetical protein